jgi:prepilin peptidase CpaA
MGEWSTWVQGTQNNHWHLWLVSAILIVAAAIDGWKLKVPNWITFPFVVAGWGYSAALFGWSGLGWSLAGTAVGLGLLLPAYAIGGWGRAT